MDGLTASALLIPCDGEFPSREGELPSGDGQPTSLVANLLYNRVTGDDSPSLWTRDDAKWAELIEGFKAAEHWQEGNTLTKANAGTISADPKDAAVVAYYQDLLGISPSRSEP